MNTIFAFGGIGAQEMILILIVFLLLFGAKKLPELARGLGKSIREFKKATTEIEDNIRDAMDEDSKTIKPAAAAKPESVSDAAAKPEASDKSNS